MTTTKICPNNSKNILNTNKIKLTNNKIINKNAIFLAFQKQKIKNPFNNSMIPSRLQPILKN